MDVLNSYRMNENAENNGVESKREASVYPYTSLGPSLKIADAVKELGGARTSVSKSSLAALLKESDKSAAFLQRVSSAKAFGLIAGRSEYILTEASKRYYFPTSENEKSTALLVCLDTPTGFRELIRRYDGDKLPSREILANILQREFGVPESWKERAAAFFENSAQLIGVIDADRFLRFKATQHSAALKSTPVQTIAPRTEAPESSRFRADKAPKEFSDQEEHSLFLDKQKTRKFTISSPLFISRAEYNRICKWLAVALIVEDEGKGKKD